MVQNKRLEQEEIDKKKEKEMKKKEEKEQMVSVTSHNIACKYRNLILSWNLRQKFRSFKKNLARQSD